MEERDQILIDRYLAGELSETELHDLQRRRHEDPAFHAELQAAELARKALQLREREALLERFRQRDILLDQKTKGKRPPFINPMWLIGLAAAVALLFIFWKFLFTGSNTVAPIDANAGDSLKLNDPPAVRIDTIQVQDTTRAINVGTKAPQKTEMADAHSKATQLFASYYQPYKDEMMNPATRGEAESKPLEIYQRAYWESDYVNAVNTFPKLDPSMQSTDNFRFSYASALLAIGKTKEAIPVLESIVDHNTSRYRTEARYALALAFLKQGNTVECLRHLDAYIADARAKELEEARKLRDQLKSK